MLEVRKMNVFVVNNEGGGSADILEVNKDTTVGALFALVMPDGASPNDYEIKVNYEANLEASFVLSDGDRVSITTLKGAGAG